MRRAVFGLRAARRYATGERRLGASIPLARRIAGLAPGNQVKTAPLAV